MAESLEQALPHVEQGDDGLGREMFAVERVQQRSARSRFLNANDAMVSKSLQYPPRGRTRCVAQSRYLTAAQWAGGACENRQGTS